MRSPIFSSVIGFALLQLLLLEASAQNGNFVDRTLPKAPAGTYGSGEWATMVESLALQPQKDVIINQPKTAGKWLSLGKQIIGGAGASLGQFPWQAYLHMDNSYLCGGSLIQTNFILTAAHCADPFTNFTVMLGNTHRYAVVEPSRVVMFTTVKFVHEAYDNQSLENDIAILKLPQHVNLNQYVNLVKLPSASDATNNFVNTTTTVSGYGRTCNNCTPSETLNFVQLTVMEPATCRSFYGSDLNTASTLCTHTKADQSTCKGDSGGPLVYMDSTNTMVQIGVVSFSAGTGCGTGPAGFARVTYYLGWIASIVGADLGSTTTSTTPVSGDTSSTPLTTTPISTPTETPPTQTSITTTNPTSTSPTLTDTSTSSTTTTSQSTSSSTTSSSTTPTASTTTKPLVTVKPTKPPHCAGANFANMFKCCKVQPTTTFVKFDFRNKVQAAIVKKCGGSIFKQNYLNQYLLNNLQDYRKGNAFDFKGRAANGAFADAASFTNCYLGASGLLANGIMTSATLKNLNLLTDTWNKAFTQCSQQVYNQTMSYTVKGKICDGRNLAVIQCMQKYIIATCGAQTTDRKCTADWLTFRNCHNIFKF